MVNFTKKGIDFPLGETFNYYGTVLKVCIDEIDDCIGCDITVEKCERYLMCDSDERIDGLTVKFKKV